MLHDRLKIRWDAQVRADIAEGRELLQLMKKVGCRVLYIGFESINPTTLKEFNKRQTVEEITEAISKIKEVGIRVHGMFVFGSDADDMQTIKDTVHFTKTAQIDTVQFLILTPVPGSRLEDGRGQRSIS